MKYWRYAVLLMALGIFMFANVILYWNDNTGIFSTNNARDFVYTYESDGMNREQFLKLNTLLYSNGFGASLDIEDSLIIGLDSYTQQGVLLRYPDNTHEIIIDGFVLSNPQEYNLILNGKSTQSLSPRGIIVGFLFVASSVITICPMIVFFINRSVMKLEV